MARRNQRDVVEATLQSIGACDIVQTRNGHGPAVSFVLGGEEYTYGFDGTPKGEYTPAKTVKAIKHAVYTKARMRGKTLEEVAPLFKDAS